MMEIVWKSQFRLTLPPTLKRDRVELKHIKIYRSNNRATGQKERTQSTMLTAS